MIAKQLYRRLLKLTKQIDDRPAFKYVMSGHTLRSFKRREFRLFKDLTDEETLNLRSVSRIVN